MPAAPQADHKPGLPQGHAGMRLLARWPPPQPAGSMLVLNSWAATQQAAGPSAASGLWLFLPQSACTSECVRIDLVRPSYHHRTVGVACVCLQRPCRALLSMKDCRNGIEIRVGSHACFLTTQRNWTIRAARGLPSTWDASHFFVRQRQGPAQGRGPQLMNITHPCSAGF